MYKHKRKASWVNQMLALIMVVVLVFSVLPCGALAAEFSADHSTVVYESVEADAPADSSTDPWDDEETIMIPTPVEDESESEPEKNKPVQGEESEEEIPSESDESIMDDPDASNPKEEPEPDISITEQETEPDTNVPEQEIEPERNPVFQIPALDEDFPDDYESDTYNSNPTPNFGIAPMAVYDGTVEWAALPYTDGQLSFELSGTTLEGATYKGLSDERVSVNETYAGNKYRTFSNTSFDNDHTITLPDAGFYIKNGKINRVKVVLQIKVINDSQGKHGTGAFITTGHPGHFGNAELLDDIGRGERAYTYIAIKPFFYYAGTNTQITDYTMTCYVTDIDPATTKTAKIRALRVGHLVPLLREPFPSAVLPS